MMRRGLGDGGEGELSGGQKGESGSESFLLCGTLSQPDVDTVGGGGRGVSGVSGVSGDGVSGGEVLLLRLLSPLGMLRSLVYRPTSDRLPQFVNSRRSTSTGARAA